MGKTMRYLVSFIYLWLVCSIYSVEVHGHRGARSKRPENTLAAFRYALAVGTPVLEMDLLVSGDGILVVHHDFHINLDLCRRITKTNPEHSGQEGPAIIDLNVAEIRTFDCGSIRNPKFPEQVLSPGEVIPTFDEVVELVKGEQNSAKVKWNLEMKSKQSSPAYSPEPQLFAQLVIEAITKHEIKENVILQSFDYRTLEAARRLDPFIKISALAGKRSPDPYDTLKKLRPDYISPDFTLVTPKLVKAAHSKAVKVIPWTVNNSQDWKKVLQAKVDGIITDDPEALLKFLQTWTP